MQANIFFRKRWFKNFKYCNKCDVSPCFHAKSTKKLVESTGWKVSPKLPYSHQRLSLTCCESPFLLFGCSLPAPCLLFIFPFLSSFFLCPFHSFLFSHRNHLLHFLESVMLHKPKSVFLQADEELASMSCLRKSKMSS